MGVARGGGSPFSKTVVVLYHVHSTCHTTSWVVHKILTDFIHLSSLFLSLPDFLLTSYNTAAPHH